MYRRIPVSFFVLLYLKHLLFEMSYLNGNILYQVFCGVMVNPSSSITNYKIVSAIRNEMIEAYGHKGVTNNPL